ncbi:MAG: zinc dependent phospholipase C family protein [Gemmatimonadetes bacterium]|nr:zinc dependent phospholipase C family protein [Gemmatimonadota bacterium]
MPRGRCHFALVLELQVQLERDLPEVGALNRQYLPDLVAGSMAPDAMRLLGKMGKYGSHFYTEEQRETWGKSVSGMFEAHPNLADYQNMDPRDRVLLMGYIAHLTTDEAFRDEVTIHVHGIEDWRPIIYGLWSYVDELPINYPGVAEVLDRFEGRGEVGFIDREIVSQFVRRARGWAESADPVVLERIFLKMIGRPPSDDLEKHLAENRGRADAFFDENIKARFVDEAIVRGRDEIEKFVSGVYSR